jgi:hypothetical protein
MAPATKSVADSNSELVSLETRRQTGASRKPRNRPDYERGAEDFIRGLRSAGIKIRAWKKDGSLANSSRALARALLEADADLRTKVGQEEVWRKVIDGTYPRAPFGRASGGSSGDGSSGTSRSLSTVLIGSPKTPRLPW